MVQDPIPATIERKSSKLHFIIGVFWLTYWMANLYIGFAQIIAFLDYYVMTALLLVYIVFARPISLIQAAQIPSMWLWVMSAAIPAIMYIDAAYGGFSFSEMSTRIVYLSALGGMTLVLLDENRVTLIRTAARLALAITVSLNFLDLVITLPFERSELRAAGLWMDPNISAAALCSMLLIAVHPLRATRLDLIIVSITLVAILATFSRSGMLFGLLLAVVYFFSPGGRESLRTGSRIAMGLALAVTFTIAGGILIQIFAIDLSMAWRIESLLTLNIGDASAQARLTRANFGIQRALEFFWTGRGLGAASFYSLHSHNAYIAILYDYGIIGLTFYVTMISQGIFQMLRYGWRRALVPGLLSTNLLYYGMFAHTVPDTAGMSIALVVFMLKIFIDPPQENKTQTSQIEPPEEVPGLLQPEHAQ